MHKIMLKIEVQCPKIIAKLYKDMITPMVRMILETIKSTALCTISSQFIADDNTTIIQC